MKDKNLKKRILPLMVISQILIVGFSLYWLIDQFKKEKTELQQKLLSHYIISEDQLIDSLIQKKFINPVLSDTNQRMINIELKIDTINYEPTNPNDIQLIKKDFSKPKSLFALKFNEKDTGTLSCDSLKTDDILVKGIRMFVHQTINVMDSAQLNNINIIHSDDTALFMEIFSDHLKKDGYNFDILWNKKTNQNNRKALFIKGGNLENNMPGAYVYQSFSYLLKLIMPQILFVLFLISLSLTAIIITYRNLLLQLNLNIQKDSFISNITHELKTPVATVKVTLEALKKYSTADNPIQSEDYLNIASKELNRLDSLINKVLDHSVLEGQVDSSKFEIINIGELISNTVQSMKLKLENSNAMITIPDHKDIFIKGDILYLEGVILNLIDNSIKYTENNPAIDISLIENSDSIQMRISDNGPGITEEFRSKIFNKFYRISNGDKHNTKGYGLGLSFAKMVMEIHNGNIEVKNNDVAGCTFILTFPKLEK